MLLIPRQINKQTNERREEKKNERQSYLHRLEFTETSNAGRMDFERMHFLIQVNQYYKYSIPGIQIVLRKMKKKNEKQNSCFG